MRKPRALATVADDELSLAEALATVTGWLADLQRRKSWGRVEVHVKEGRVIRYEKNESVIADEHN